MKYIQNEGTSFHVIPIKCINLRLREPFTGSIWRRGLFCSAHRATLCWLTNKGTFSTPLRLWYWQAFKRLSDDSTQPTDTGVTGKRETGGEWGSPVLIHQMLKRCGMHLWHTRCDFPLKHVLSPPPPSTPYTLWCLQWLAVLLPETCVIVFVWKEPKAGLLFSVKTQCNTVMVAKVVSLPDGNPE